MMGVFSRFSASKPPLASSPTSQQNTKEEPRISRDTARFSFESVIDYREGFVSVEYPMEPVENDQPVQCPQPEPCIINDGLLWKERQCRIKNAHEQGLQYLRPNITGEMQAKQSVASQAPSTELPQRGGSPDNSR